MNNQPKKPKIQGKKGAHRDAIIRSLVLELIRNERLQSTPTKVRLLKQRFDRLVTEAKKDTAASKRRVEGFLRHDKAITKFYGNLLPRLENDNSGYTQTARTLARKGDAAEQMVILVKGAEIREKKSKLRSLLDSTNEPKKPKTVAKPDKTLEKKVDVKKKESVVNTRRNSK